MTSYTFIDKPQRPPAADGSSPVHELYPGRPLNEKESNTAFDRYQVPHEHPKQARETFMTRKSEMSKNAHALEGMARHNMDSMGRSGSDPKFLTHAVDDPFQTVDDPQERFVTRMDPPAHNNNYPFSPPTSQPRYRNLTGTEPFDTFTGDLPGDPSMGQADYNRQTRPNPPGHSGQPGTAMPPPQKAMTGPQHHLHHLHHHTQEENDKRLSIALGAFVVVGVLLMMSVLKAR